MYRAADLLLFAEVARCMSFSKASQELGLARSMVSKRIHRLETELGVRLLNRTTRRVSLTEAGETFFRRCQEISEAVSLAEDEIRNQNSVPSGVLKLSMPVMLGRILARSVFPLFLQRYPALRISVDLSDEYVDIVGSGYDAVVRVGTLPDSTLVARKIGVTQLVMCATPDYLARHGTPTHPRDLEAHQCLVLATASVEGGVWRLIAQNGPLAVRVRGRVHSSSDLALLELACLGHGIIYIPWFAVRDEVLGGRLQLLLEPYCRLERGVYVIYPQRRNMPAKVSAFADFLAAHVEWSGTVPANVST